MRCGLRRSIVGNSRLLDGFAGRDLDLFGFSLTQRPLACDFGALQGAAHLDVTLLVEAGGLALAFDIECLPFGFEVPGADPDHRILLDVVAQFASGFDLLHQAGQAFGVEAIRGIEVFEVGLVEVGDGDGFEFEAVLRQRLGGAGLDARDILAALLVHLFHRHFRGDGADRRDELAGKQRVELFRLHGAASERCRSDRDGFSRGLDADVEVGLDVDAHPVAGDDGILS
jgi:hypothetical protein